MSDDDDRELTAIDMGRMGQVEHLLAIGQHKRAREMAAQQIAAEPSNPESYVSMTRVLLQSGERKAAIDAAAQAIELAPEWSTTWSMHAAALLAAGRFAQCETSLLQAIALDPEETALFQMYARVLSLCGRNKEALEHARRALELDPDDDSAHQLFAALLHQVHPSHWKISLELAERAVGLNPDDPDSYAVLGAILYTQRRFAEAEEHFRTALEIDPNNHLALEGLAQVVMAKNWFYKPFLSYQLAMMRLGTAAQLTVVASLWAVVSIVNAAFFASEGGSDLLTFGYLAFCAYTWFAVPITRAILRRRYPWL